MSNHHNHHEHHDHSEMIIEYRNLFFVSLILTIPILILSPMIQEWFNYSLSFKGDIYVILILATIISVYPGKPFFTGAYDELKRKTPGMMSLISLAIIISYSYSTATLFGLKGNDFFWELATLIVIMLLGHYIEMKSSEKAESELKSLNELMPSEATLFKDGKTKTVSISDLNINDIVLVRPGEKVPVDGIITKGESTFDESMITGESVPVLKNKDDELIAGTINGDNIVLVKVLKLGKDTYLEQVIKLVSDAKLNRSKTERLADVFAKYLFYISIIAATLTAIIWILSGASSNFVLERVVTVIIIACPHALGLAIPLVTSVSTSIAAKNGLLIKNRTHFENGRKINALVFDKTGTLTKGEFKVNTFESFNNEDALNVIYSLEKNSTHPIAKGIVKYAKEKDAKELEVKDFKNISGIGISAKINNDNYMAVSPKYVDEQNIKYDKELVKNIYNNGETITILLKNNQVISIIGLVDEIRESSYEVIKSLKERGIRTILLTGDNKRVGEIVKDKLNMDEVISEVMPHEKAEIIKELKKKYNVAMTGDGINDAIALAESDLGIAIGAGTDVAIDAADIILVKSNPHDVLALLDLSKKTYSKTIQNLIWATAYNIIALPLAAGVLFKYNINISPALGAILMSLSSVIVAINARLLKI